MVNIFDQPALAFKIFFVNNQILNTFYPDTFWIWALEITFRVGRWVGWVVGKLENKAIRSFELYIWVWQNVKANMNHDGIVNKYIKQIAGLQFVLLSINFLY